MGRMTRRTEKNRTGPKRELRAAKAADGNDTGVRRSGQLPQAPAT